MRAAHWARREICGVSLSLVSVCCFDVCNVSRYCQVQITNGAAVLPGVPQVVDPLFMTGSFLPRVGSFQVNLGVRKPGFAFQCAVSAVTSTWLVCTPQENSGNVPGAAYLPFSIWDTGTLVVATSAATYTYFAIPNISSIVGCQPAQPDSTTGLTVATVNCPTAGGTVVTLTGANFFTPFQALVNGLYPCVLPSNVDDVLLNTSNTQFSCTLPQLTGTSLAFSVSSGTTVTMASALSYALPDIQSILGCMPSQDAINPGIVNCNRFGGDLVTIVGSQFGAGGRVAAARVLVGGKVCRVVSSNETTIVCLTGPGRVTLNQLIVLQYTGGMTTDSPLTLSYRQCPVGEYQNNSAPLNCLPCERNTYSNTLNALTCLPCPTGYIGLTRGLSACSPCLPGTFWNSTGVCLNCTTGTFSDNPAQTACNPCPAGQYNQAPGGSTCAPCVAGTYSNDPAHPVQCFPCAAGTFSSTTSASVCGKCGVDTYAPEVGAAMVGTIICSRCTTNAHAPQGSAKCACASGFYYFGTECVPCPVGADCASSSDTARQLTTLASQAEYWRLNDVAADVYPPQFYICPLPGACPGSNNGTCNLGYMGPTCAFCQPGYHLDNLGCVACIGGTKAMLPVVICGAIMVALAIYWIGRRFNAKKVIGVMQILIGYFQVRSVFVFNIAALDGWSVI